MLNVYLEPKWPLFWLEKAFFWRVLKLFVLEGEAYLLFTWIVQPRRKVGTVVKK